MQQLFDARLVDVPQLYVRDKDVTVPRSSVNFLAVKPSDRVLVHGTEDGISLELTDQMDESGFFLRKAGGTVNTLRICSTGLVQRLIKHFGCEPPFVLEWDDEEYKLKR